MFKFKQWMKNQLAYVKRNIAKVQINKYQVVGLFAIVFFTASSMSIVSPGGAVVNNSLATKMQISVPLTDMYIYDSSYKPYNYLVNANSFNASPIQGFTLLKTDSKIDLSKSTFISDNVPLGSTGINFYDRPVYSKTFGNDTYNAPVESNATATTTVGTTISNSGTQASFSVTNDAIAASNTAYSTSTFAIDQNNDGLYTGASDYAYLPLQFTSVWVYVGVKTTFSASPNAADYGSLTLSFARTSGTPWNITIKEWATTGTSGWTNTTNIATYNCYSADGAFVGVSIPVNTLYTAIGESGTLQGLASITWKGLVAGASDSVTMDGTGVNFFNNIPAVTSRTDSDNNFNYNGAQGIPTGIHESDGDFLFTELSAPTSTTYTSTIPLIADWSGVINTLIGIRKLTITGVASIQPLSSSYSTSSPVSGQNYYTTNEHVIFDTRSITTMNQNGGSFANVFSWGNLKINITVSDSVFPFTTSYGDNLLNFNVNYIDQTATMKNALNAVGVSGSSSPKSQVQYDFTENTVTGQYLPVTDSIYTLTAFNIQSVTTSSPGPTSTTSGAGAGNNGNYPPPSSNNTMFIWLLAGLGIITVIIAVRSYKKKK